jgi:dCTP deaminase
MSLLTYTQLVKLVETGVIQNVKPEHLNAASIDLTLGPVLHLESAGSMNYESEFPTGIWDAPIDLWDKQQSIHTREWVMDENGYVVEPGEFLLASSEQIFHLPSGQYPEINSGEIRQIKLQFIPAIAAEYKLKSTLARSGLDHLNAGWADPGWHGSVLTLEFKNVTRFHRLRIKPGMKIGQIIFFSGEPVPVEASYATRGSYNNDTQTTPSKGLK